MRQLYTELNDRVLRFDGVSIVDPEQVPNIFSRGVSVRKIRVTHEDEEVANFNQQVAEVDRLLVAEDEPIPITMEWQLDDEYKNMDLLHRVLTDFEARMPELDYTERQFEEAANRIELELKEIQRRGMVEFIRTVVYILDTFRKKNIVWGVGRGSSCASYILFILGLHVVDCVKLDVPMIEFFHD